MRELTQLRPIPRRRARASYITVREDAAMTEKERKIKRKIMIMKKIKSTIKIKSKIT